MLPKEIIKKIRRIDIITNRVVTEVLSGRYHSVFKGRGIEFSEVREYQYGDDIRSIDWNVFARLGHPYIKKFVEERELNVILMVDLSASMRFGTRGNFKSEIAAEIGALLAFSAIRNNDKVGLLLFSDIIEKFIRPDKGKTHVLSLIRDVLCFNSHQNKTDLTNALSYLNRVVKKRCVVFVISDFLFDGYEKMLKISNKRHDVIPIVLMDVMEDNLPDIGYIEMQDAETGDTVLFKAKDLKEKYQEQRQIFKDKQKSFFQKNNIEEIRLYTNQDYIAPIIKYFRKRAHKR